jgi:GTP cyclohydrolase I
MALVAAGFAFGVALALTPGKVRAAAAVNVDDMSDSVQSIRDITPGRRFDRDAIVEAVRTILDAVGEDAERDGLRRTPERVADMYAEIFAGIGRNPSTDLDVVFEAGHDEMIMVRDIPLASMCEHHLIPFIGKAHVAYIPNESGQITGLSKIARLVDTLSRQPQVQERLTTQIADAIENALDPRGVLVVIEAEHLCMTMRGVRVPGTLAVTSAVRGQFLADPATRAEAMDFIRGRR